MKLNERAGKFSKVAKVTRENIERFGGKSDLNCLPNLKYLAKRNGKEFAKNSFH